MSATINIHEAKTQLSALVSRAEAGEDEDDLVLLSRDAILSEYGIRRLC